MVARKKQTRSFCPDEISTLIHQALERDLGPLLQEYSGPGLAHQHAVQSQVDELRKKYCSPTQDKERLTRECFDSFLKVNEHMRSVNSHIKAEVAKMGSRLNTQSGDSALSKLLRRMRSICYQVLGDFDTDSWVRHCRHSTGSSIGVPFRDTSVERKFEFPISSTARASKYFNYYLKHDSRLRRDVWQRNRCTPTLETKDWLMFDIVEGSRASTVDKTTEKRRMICVEPTANMFLQLGVMETMYDLLKMVGLDVESLPELHKVLAMRASLSGDKATIDFRSASDCVSYELLRYVLPPSWFAIIDALRCRYTIIDGVRHELHMVSSMGNATTFPLETLVFWALGHASRYEDNSNRLLLDAEEFGLVSVFGDDCIVETADAKNFKAAAESVGFFVNEEKSFFSEGPGFRESCGGDYLNGYPVRPFCLKAPPQVRMSHLEPWLYTMMNRLTDKYIQYFGALTYVYDKELFKVFALLFEKHKLKLRFVPPDYPDDSGLQSLDFYRILDYGFATSKISRSNQGTFRFNYKRFVYSSDENSWDGDLRYHLRLKLLSAGIGDLGVSSCNATQHLGKAPRELKHSYRSKENGGYVDAVGYTSHWFVPSLTRRSNTNTQLTLVANGERPNKQRRRRPTPNTRSSLTRLAG